MSQNALTLVVGWPNKQFQNTNTSVQTGTMIRKTVVNIHWRKKNTSCVLGSIVE